GAVLAQDRDPRPLPRRPLLPALAAVAGAVHAEAPARGDAVLGALLRHDPRRVRVARMNREREAEAARQAVAVEPLPRVAAVVRAVDAAVVLLPEPLRLLGMREQLVDALADLGVRVVRKEVGGDVLAHGRPALA